MAVRLLAVCGSLRRASASAELLRAAARLAPPGVEVVFAAGPAALPHFNPDDEAAGGPAVSRWRAELAEAAGLLVCSPEYAHGVPGSLKNALDWVVGSGELAGKPVALLNAAPRAAHAQEQLREVLRTIAARVVGVVAVPVGGLDAERIAGDAALAGPVRDAVRAVVAAAGL